MYTFPNSECSITLYTLKKNFMSVFVHVCSWDRYKNGEQIARVGGRGSAHSGIRDKDQQRRTSSLLIPILPARVNHYVDQCFST